MALNQHTMRTPETQKAYMHYLQHEYDGHCIYCEKEMLVKEYEHWIIIENRFMYDRVWNVNRQLATKRHIQSERDLTKEELEEKCDILEKWEADRYTQCVFNAPPNKSLPEHLHYHLLHGLKI